MKFEPVTIKDIGKALGLSTSTVSRALRGSYEISAETKKLVLEYAEKINYRPNPIALSLKERRNHSIGIIVCEIANNYFSQAINGIESIAYNRGYHVIISQSHESYERETVIVDHLASRSVDGLLVSLSSGTKDYTHLKQLYEKGLPIVFFDRIAGEINTHKVIADNFKGAFDATEHLIQNGFRRIAHITSAPYLSISVERLEGYKEALRKNNIEYDEKLVQFCDNGGMNYDEVEDALKKLFKQKPKMDALFTAGDRITTTTMQALQKLNKKIPEDVGVIGFTNTNLGDIFNPPLSVVRQPAFEIGQVATELLISMIESKRPVTEFETKAMQTELIVRESSIKKS
ncbi:MAG: LacI family DNA-binding transcriptional regulator [Ferruginibacter sp.]